MNILAFIYKISSYIKDDLTKINYYSIAWIFSRFCVAGIVTMVFIICSINTSYYFGLLGCTLTLLSIVLNNHANYAIPDVPMSFFIMLFFLIISINNGNENWDKKREIFLAIVAGLAISMKYTAALLLPSLIIVSVKTVSKYKIFIPSTKLINMILLLLGIVFLFISTIVMINHQIFLDYFTKLTTDGILEIEYIDTFKNVNKLIIILGIFFIILSLLNKHIKSELIALLFSPFQLLIIIFVIITFSFFSPFTLIEYKKSFADFMYEYRHMHIGSAAHYHHLSSDYRAILGNLSSSTSALFYIKLIHNNIGIACIMLSCFGLYMLYRQNITFAIPMVIYTLLLMLTLFSWKNYAERYILSIFPILIIFAVYGLFTTCNIISKRTSVKKYLVTGLLSIITLIHPIVNFINNY